MVMDKPPYQFESGSIVTPRPIIKSRNDKSRATEKVWMDPINNEAINAPTSDPIPPKTTTTKTILFRKNNN